MDTVRLKKLCRCVFRALAVLINNLYCIPTYVIWCILLHPLYYLNADLYWKIEGQFFHWLLTMVGFWSYSAGYYIVETGDVIERIVNDETLILVNHQSTSDVPLLMHAFCARDKLLQNLNWIMDAVFQYTNFGVVSTLHGDFFINAGRDRRDASLKELENYLRTKFLPRKRKWLVLFPEGGFLRKRKEASKRYATKMNLPNLEYVTLPRLGALQTIINTLAPADMSSEATEGDANSNSAAGDAASSGLPIKKNNGKLKYIIDMTLAYKNGDPLDLGSVITGSVPSCQVRMHYKIFPINEVPHEDPDKMQSWLYKLYIEKNNMLGHYYKTGLWDPKYATINTNELHSVSWKEKTCMTPSPSLASGEGVPLTGTDVVDEARPVPLSPLCDPGVMNSNIMKLLHSKSATTETSESELDHDAEMNKLNNINNCSAADETLSDEERNQKVPASDKTLQLDLLRIIIIHVMFFTSTVLHIRAFYNMFSYIGEKY